MKYITYLLSTLLFILYSCSNTQEQNAKRGTSIPQKTQDDTVVINNTISETKDSLSIPINQTNEAGKRIGFWENPKEWYGASHLKYDSTGRLEGFVNLFNNGSFNWAMPRLIVDNHTPLQVKKLFGHNIKGMIAGVSICKTTTKNLLVKVHSEIYNSETGEVDSLYFIHIGADGKLLSTKPQSKIYNSETGEVDSLYFLYIGANGKLLSSKSQSNNCINAKEAILTQQGRPNRPQRRYFNTSFGKFDFESPESLCADTQLSKLKLTTKQGVLSLGLGGNLQVAEYDMDKDGVKEIYVFSFFSCQSYLEIYQIKR